MESRTLYLTFDGGPNPPGTDLLVDCLDHYGVQATFFLEGHRLVNEAECARRVVNAGHEVGNHSYSHAHLDELDIEAVGDEIARAQSIIRSETGVVPDQFRPPWGRIRPDVVEAILANDHDMVLWNRSVRDWEGPDAVSIADRMLAGLGDGAIFVLHDRIAENSEVLDRFIPQVLDAGYGFRFVSEAPASTAVVRRSRVRAVAPGPMKGS